MKFAPLLLIVLLALACTSNTPWRTEPLVRCEGDACAKTFIESHETYDLAFVEFTERGNVFSRERLNSVLDYVEAQAATPEGALVVVFVHGWKHNASAEDGNVKSFRRMMKNVARLQKETAAASEPAGTPRNVVGVYVGWRGLSIDAGFLTNVTYWERKATAEQVGKGGVTELLLRLERRVIGNQESDKNLYLVAGHSFGGAIVLTAVNEVLMERMISAETLVKPENPEWGDAWVRTRPFGHGVVLLNPAIEANTALQLKELSSELRFANTQQKLMHVISSDGDSATHVAFRAGQYLGVNLRTRQAELERSYTRQDGEMIDFVLEEASLDTKTVGNYQGFRTGRLNPDPQNKDRWKYVSCLHEPDCVPSKRREEHIPVTPYEPIQFLYTDETFIADHNDVFNQNVIAYLSAIVAENRAFRFEQEGSVQARSLVKPGDGIAACEGGAKSFDFGKCFTQYLDQLEKIRAEDKE